MAFNLALKTVKTALVQALSPSDNKAWKCVLCNGRVTAAEIQTFSSYAPGILVTVLNVDGWDQANQTVTFAAFTLGRDQVCPVNDKKQKVSKGEIAEALALAVMDVALYTVLPGAISRPEQFRAQNLYSGGVHDQGAALWGVTWKQDFNLRQTDQGELVNMLEVWLRPTEEHTGPYAEATIDVSQPPPQEI